MKKNKIILMSAVILSVIASGDMMEVNTIADDKGIIEVETDDDNYDSQFTENQKLVQEGGKWYLYQYGNLSKGLLGYKDKLYYFSEKDGAMQTGWIYTGGYWYYADESGVIQTSCWIQSNSKWYFLYNDGKMAVSTQINKYIIGSDGAWTGQVAETSVKNEFTMKTESKSYKEGVKEIKLIYTNTTYNEQGIGREYSIEKYKNGSWKKVNPSEDIAFTEEVMLIGAGTTTDETIALSPYYNLDKGHYKIIKTGDNLEAEFDIV